MFSTQALILVFLALFSNIILTAFWYQYHKIPFSHFIESNSVVFIGLTLFLIWFGIFFIYRFSVSGDVVLFFIPQIKQVFSGLIPNRDFSSSYMPLFPYVIGIPYIVFGSSKYALGAFFTICLVVFSAISKKIYRQTSDSDGLELLFVGILNSIIWILGVGYQQDECYILLWISVLLYSLVQKKNLLGGVLSGIALLSTKITFLIFIFVFFLLSKDKKRFLIGFVTSFVPLITLFIVLGFQPIGMISGESNAFVPPSIITNLKFFPNFLEFIHQNPLIFYGFVGLLLGIIAYYLIYKNKDNDLLKYYYAFITIFWLSFILLSFKSLTSYRIMAIPFIPFVINKFKNRHNFLPWVFCLYTFLVSIHVMLYEDWGKISRVYNLISAVPSSLLPQYLILTFIEILIPALELLWIFLSVKIVLDGKKMNRGNCYAQ